MSGFCPSPYKDVFPSMTAARKAVSHIQQRTKRGKTHSLAQEPYKCNCGEYHLAHPSRKRAYDNEKHRQKQRVVSW